MKERVSGDEQENDLILKNNHTFVYWMESSQSVQMGRCVVSGLTKQRCPLLVALVAHPAAEQQRNVSTQRFNTRVTVGTLMISPFFCFLLPTTSLLFNCLNNNNDEYYV